jgi:hypothetical protein
MLVFEQPDEPILWLGRAAPRVWMESGKHFGVSGAPTSFGIVGYQVTSDLAHDKVAATVEMPADKAVIVKLRLRTPGRRTIHSVTVNGSNWSSFSQSDEAIDLPASSLHGTVQVTVVYE